MVKHTFILTVATTLLLGAVASQAAEPQRDPTRPYSAPVANTNVTGFRTTAVFVARDRRIAIVNGKRVAKGDRVDGAIVVEILSDQVRLNLHGKAISARLLPAAERR